MVRFADKAKKGLSRIPDADRRRIVARLAAYAETPRDPRHDVVKLVNRPELYRLRAGDWRAIFRVEGDVVEVLQVQHRREAYR